MSSFLRFLLLVVILNIIRYIVGYPFERLVVFDRLFGAMERNPFCFNTRFTAFDWTTSYFYNFLMWLTITWVYVKINPVLAGNPVVKSLKVYAIMFLFFASVSAIYMNHYRHPKDFYIFNILDALLVFPLVAVANGLIYPLLFKTDSRLSGYRA